MHKLKALHNRHVRKSWVVVTVLTIVFVLCGCENPFARSTSLDPAPSADGGIPAAAPPQAPVSSGLPPPVTTGDYAGLGDSFSAGEGAPRIEIQNGKKKRIYIDRNVDNCHRSTEAYAYKVQHALSINPQTNFRLKFGACSGAVIDNYSNSQKSGSNKAPQRKYLDEQTKLVTFSFGGNDAGFAKVVAACATELVGKYCGDTVRHNLAKMPGIGFRDLYRKVLKDAQNARILVVGYPRAFPLDPQPADECKTNAPRRSA